MFKDRYVRRSCRHQLLRTRQAALLWALGASLLWHVPALAQEAQQAQPPESLSAAGSIPDEAQVKALPANLDRVPQPQVAPPVNRKKPAFVRIELETKSVTGLLANGIGYEYWTYNGTVPGPMIRVRQGDTNTAGSGKHLSIQGHEAWRLYLPLCDADDPLPPRARALWPYGCRAARRIPQG